MWTGKWSAGPAPGLWDLPALAEGIQATDGETLLESSIGLRRLMSVEKDQWLSVQQLLGTGIAPTLIGLLSSEQAVELQCEVGSILSIIASTDSEQCATIVEHGAVRAAVLLLSAPNNTGLQDKMLRLLVSIAGDSTHQRDYVVECGVIEPTFRIVEQQMPACTLLLSAAVRLLGSLCAGSPLPSAEVISPVAFTLCSLVLDKCDLLDACRAKDIPSDEDCSDEDVLTEACSALVHLCREETLYSTVEQTGIMGRLEPLLTHRASAVRLACCELFWTSCSAAVLDENSRLLQPYESSNQTNLDASIHRLRWLQPSTCDWLIDVAEAHAAAADDWSPIRAANRSTNLASEKQVAVVPELRDWLCGQLARSILPTLSILFGSFSSLCVQEVFIIKSAASKVEIDVDDSISTTSSTSDSSDSTTSFDTESSSGSSSSSSSSSGGTSNKKNSQTAAAPAQPSPDSLKPLHVESFVTFRVLLSAPSSFDHGGTFFHNLGDSIRLEQAGDVLMFGNEVSYCEGNLSSGTQYILVGTVALLPRNSGAE